MRLSVAAKLVAFGVFLALCAPHRARADVVPRCVSAYEQAQRLRTAKKLVEARDTLMVCAAAECPTAIEDDCVRWLRDMEQAVPTVIFSARGAEGHDLTDVRVRMDGQPLLQRLDGSATAIDQGQHTFRFEHGGDPPVEVSVLVNEGERNRVVHVTLGAPRAAPPSRSRAASPWSYVFGAVGLVAGGIGAGLDGLALSRYDHDRATCGKQGPYCSTAEGDSVRNLALAGDVLIGCGVLSLGAGVVMFFATRKTGSETGISFRVLPGGGGVVGTF